jgi:hypothetical protein
MLFTSKFVIPCSVFCGSLVYHLSSGAYRPTGTKYSGCSSAGSLAIAFTSASLKAPITAV